MNIFVDTSDFLAVLDGSDVNHAKAKTFWEKLISEGEVLLCHNYMLVETSTLILRRLGIEAIRVFAQDIIPILRIIWVTKEIHTSAVSAHLVADRHTLSFVDCVSFEILQRTGVHRAFAFDRHFRDYGFERNPKG